MRVFFNKLEQLNLEGKVGFSSIKMGTIYLLAIEQDHYTSCKNTKISEKFELL